MLWNINYLNCGFEQPGKSFTNINAAYLTLNTATMNECCNILFASLLLMLYVPADLHVFIVVFAFSKARFSRDETQLFYKPGINSGLFALM